VTVIQVAQQILNFDGNSKIGVAEQRRIVGVLRELGWPQKRDMNGRYYYRPKPLHDAHDAYDTGF
jgi:hypothetical protein